MYSKVHMNTHILPHKQIFDVLKDNIFEHVKNCDTAVFKIKYFSQILRWPARQTTVSLQIWTSKF